MDLSQDFFLALPQFEKAAYANLSTNVGDWVHDITKIVYDKIPFITQFPTKIKLERVDEQKGYGYGSIKVGQKLDIPIVIKNFELQPLDVFISAVKFSPLSETRLEETLFNPETFGAPADVSGLDQSIYQSNYPPHSGKYVYASQNFLKKISSSIKKEHKEKFAQSIDDGIFASFKNTGNLRVLETALKLKVGEKKPVSSVLPVNVLQIEKIADDKFEVKVTSDKLYDPQTTVISKKALLSKFSADVANEVLDKGVFTTIQGTRPYRPVLCEDLEGEAELVKKPGHYQVMDTDGNLRLGWVFPNVIDFDIKKTGDKLYTDGLSYALQSDIVGIETESPAHPEDRGEIKYCEPQEGKTGVFLFSKGGKDVVTIPVTVCSPIFDLGTHIRFEASDIYGRAFIIEISSGVKSITKSKYQESTYLVPADAKFVSVGRKVVRLQDSTKDHKINVEAIKNASEKNVIIVTCSDGNVFDLAGNNLKELVADSRGIGHNKAKWYLVSLGLTPREAEYALHRAKSSGTCKIKDTKVLLTHSEKMGEVLMNRTYAKLKDNTPLRQNLIKEASVLDDEQTVDKVLSLFFLTPENEATFMTYLPSFEDAASKLAQLLIAVRVGMKRIPETAVKSAMQGLEVVIAGLRSREALQNVSTPEDSLS